jgi:probable phosphoglycerate mutase
MERLLFQSFVAANRGRPGGTTKEGRRSRQAIATSTILLIRHAAHAHVGHTLSGRMPGLALTEEGERQALELSRRLTGERPDIVQSSPVERARQTAQAIAAACGREVDVAGGLEEVDFGEWTGSSFAELENDPRWRFWNARRSEAEAPGGESMAAAQQRALRHMRETAARQPGGTVAMVTHCDIIRALVAAILGLSLDHILRFDVGPASVTRIAAGDWGARLTSLNEGAA